MFPLSNFVYPSVAFCGWRLNLIIMKVGQLDGSLKPTYSVHVYFISPRPFPWEKYVKKKHKNTGWVTVSRRTTEYATDPNTRNTLTVVVFTARGYKLVYRSVTCQLVSCCWCCLGSYIVLPNCPALTCKFAIMLPVVLSTRNYLIAEWLGRSVVVCRLSGRRETVLILVSSIIIGI